MIIKKIKNFIKIPLPNKKMFLKAKLLNWYYKLKYGSFGQNSVIEKPTLIQNEKNIRIGDNVTIRKGIRLEPINIWMGKDYYPQIIIENNVNIEQYCHITCGEKIEIGNNVSITGFCVITDITHTYDNIDVGPQQQPITTHPVRIEDGCFIGMGACILPGVHIGKHCIIGANAVISVDIPDYCVVVGIPGKIIKRFDPSKQIWVKTDIKDQITNGE